MGKYLFIILLFFISCKKKEQEVIPTIYPLSYLPVYPGSKWIYLNEAGDTVIQSTSASYELHQYASDKLYGEVTDYVYVPFWNGNPMYAYSTPIDNQTAAATHYGLTQVGYLSEHEGDKWLVYGSQYGSRYRKVENANTSIIVNSINYDNVVKVKDYGHASYRNDYIICISYYAKNIGLVKEDYFRGDTIYKHIDILSYYINH
jgi:hypothetical protein